MSPPATDPSKETPQRIVDSALELADSSSWEAVRLYEVAATLELSLDDIRRHFREKDELVDAWFDRADQAMLADAAEPDYLDLSVRERLQRTIFSWLGALAPHRRVTREMIQSKAELGHIHIQVPAVMRISRTVQWMREAAHRDLTHHHRALEETALTSIYLVTFLHWLGDESKDAERTHRLLERLLMLAETAALALGSLPPPFDSRSGDSQAQSPGRQVNQKPT
jgi:AcrR family transcriptional regulator